MNRIRNGALTFLLVAPAIFAQNDRPGPQDLADQQKKARSQKEDQEKLLGEAGQIVANKQRVDPLAKQSAQLQLQIMNCLNTGDYQRVENGIYSQAATEAGKQAQELEAKAANASSTPASTTNAEMAHQLVKVRERIAALESQGAKTDIEAAEIRDLRNHQKQLADTLEILNGLPPARDPAMYAEAARKMRHKENLFLTKAGGAKALVEVSDRRCRAFQAALGTLLEQAQIEHILQTWDPLTGPMPLAAPMIPASNPMKTVSTMQRELEQLRQQLKKYEQVLSDPEALRKQAEHLNSLTLQPGSN